MYAPAPHPPYILCRRCCYCSCSSRSRFCDGCPYLLHLTSVILRSTLSVAHACAVSSLALRPGDGRGADECVRCADVADDVVADDIATGAAGPAATVECAVWIPGARMRLEPGRGLGRRSAA
eukprot:68654-Chlamydomonas_euryale.AAC.9